MHTPNLKSSKPALPEPYKKMSNTPTRKGLNDDSQYFTENSSVPKFWKTKAEKKEQFDNSQSSIANMNA